ncbi:MAG: hypothetical protein ACO21P_08500 [Candidatus Nanopelagicales bacterium]
MRRVMAAAVGAVLAVGALSACGSATDRAEDAMNDALSGSASVSVGEDGGIKVEASEGTMEIGTGQLPADWPTSVPTPDGFDVVMAGSTPEGAFNASFQASGNQMGAVDDYVKLLMNSGFAVNGDIPLGANGMYGLVGNGYQVDMLAVPMGETTQLQMRIEPVS